jgi:putative copper resistance protein D
VSEIKACAIVDWPLLACLLGMFGTAVFALAAPEAGGRNREFAPAAVAPFWRSLAAINLALTPAGLILAIRDMADTTILGAFGFLPRTVTDTHAGRMWAVRIVIAALLIGAIAMRTSARTRAIAVATLSGAALLVIATMSHAVDHGALAVAVYFAHEVAAGTWGGALLTVYIAATVAQAGPEWLSAVTPRLSRVAGWSVAVLVATGVSTVAVTSHWEPGNLLRSDYGHTLILKVAIVGFTLLFGAYNRYRVVPEIEDPTARALLMRNLAAESFLLLIVLGVTAVLINLPPPH